MALSKTSTELRQALCPVEGPGEQVATLLVLALGVGATAAIFSTVYALMLKA